MMITFTKQQDLNYYDLISLLVLTICHHACENLLKPSSIELLTQHVTITNSFDLQQMLH